MPFYGPSGGAISIGDTITGGTTSRVLYVGSGPVLAQDAGLTFDGSTLTVGTGNTGSVASLNVTNGTSTGNLLKLSDNAADVWIVNGKGQIQHSVDLALATDGTEKLYNAWCYFPSSPTATIEGATYAFNTAGSASQESWGWSVALNAGYTGSSRTIAFRNFNHVAGTGSNYAYTSLCNGTTTGTNYGGEFTAQNGDINIGFQSKATTTKNGATNLAVVGLGINGGTTPTQIGGYFALKGSTASLTSAALIADNGSQTDPIALFRDNASTKAGFYDPAGNNFFQIATGALIDTYEAFHLTTTFPTTLTADLAAVKWNITSSGSSSFRQDAFVVNLQAGYTGSTDTRVGKFDNDTAGTGSNIGLHMTSKGTTTGTNNGALCVAQNADLNIGAVCRAPTDKANAINIGGEFYASNTSGGATQVGFYAFLGTSTGSVTSAAMLVDNKTTTDPIALFRDNGSVKAGFYDPTANDFFQIATGTLTDGYEAFSLTATMPTTITANSAGISKTITSAGSSSFTPIAESITFGSGYTGSSVTYGLNVTSNVAGTNTSSGNIAVSGTTSATTTGNNTGGSFNAAGGDRNIGVVGFVFSAKVGGTNIGGYSLASNNSGDIKIGHVATLNFAAPSESAAFIADNAAFDDPIALFQHNGTNIVEIDSVGNINSSASLALNQVSKTTTYTALVTDSTILCDTSGGAWTLTLYTAVGNTGRRITIKKTTSDTNKLTIDGNGSETIDIRTENSTTVGIWAQYSFLTLESDGSNWLCVDDGLRSHQARMTRDAAQSIAHFTSAQVLFDNIDYDDAGIADIVTNNRFDILRDGKYTVSGSAYMVGIDDTEFYQMQIYVNGVVNTNHRVLSSVLDGQMNIVTSDSFDLSAGDYIALHIAHNEGGSVNTATGAHTKPRCVVTEIR